MAIEAIRAVLAISPRAAFRVWRRELAVYSKTYKANVLPNFFEPLIYLAGMGLGLGTYVPEIGGTTYLDYIAPGLMASAAMNGALFECTWNMFVRLVFDRTYDAIIATPCGPEDVVLGEILWAVTRSTIYGGAFLLVLILFGPMRTPGAVLAFLACPLIGLMFASIATVFTALIKVIDFYSYFYTLFVTPMFIFGGIFFPLDALPAGLRGVAWFTPLHHAVELLRAFSRGGPAGECLVHIGWMVACTALFLPPAVHLMRKRMVA